MLKHRILQCLWWACCSH